MPTAAREDALQQVLDLGVPALLSANRAFHRLLVGGVPVQYQLDGETRGDFVRLVDWVDVSRNEFWAVNQFTVKGPHHTRRPDIILFITGLPLVLMELKNPADEKADVWKAFDQIQTYKEQIPDVFQTNEVLVISDGTEALLGSLSADPERFMAWRTIDGVALDPLGKFNELQTLVRGVLAPQYLLDYLRYFVLFEDDGALVKKIAGYHQFHAVRTAIARVVAASRPDGAAGIKGKGGVVWHTQGSGKSITMVCFAARVMQEPAMENPTIVVITDEAHRTQYGFEAKLKAKKWPSLSPASTGGALRTGNGVTPQHTVQLAPPQAVAQHYQVGYAQHLRDALPQATFVAFTGTPVASADRDTRAVFGDYIHVYDMQ